MTPNPAPSGTVGSTNRRASGGLDAAAEVERLRTLLEKQASCLMRVAVDGTLLAVSDAALSLLGARELAQALDTNFVTRIHGEDAGRVWVDFVDRVSSGGSASAECEMTDLAGARRAVILLGVALPAHPDGTASLFVTVRDVSAVRRLEASLQEQEHLRRSVDEQKTQLATALADRQRLEQAVADRAAVQAALEAATLKLQQLNVKLDQAVSEKGRVQAAFDAGAAQRQQIASSIEQLTSALVAAVKAASLMRQALEKETPK